MKCNVCGTEYEGEFCPNCNNSMSEDSHDRENEVTSKVNNEAKDDSTVGILNSTDDKGNKPFYNRPLYMVPIVVIVLCIAILVLLRFDKGDPEKTNVVKGEWAKVELGEKIPQPASTKMEIYNNTYEELNVDVKGVSDDEYAKYIDACEDRGYTVDKDKTEWSFLAYNKEGYKLSVDHFDEEMSIYLYAPLKLVKITWPKSKAGKLMPKPKSLKGKIEYDESTGFYIYIGNSTPDDYAEYVSAVQDSGFDVDYDKGDTYYYAENADGYEVSLTYHGFNTMSICVEAPDGSGTSSDKSDKDDVEDKKKEDKETSKKNDSEKLDDGKIGSDFKKAMDSYEEFMDEYVEFMKKYKKNPTDMKLLSDYSDYMSKYTKCMKSFEKWEDEDLNDAEMAYYLKVQSRVTEKLADVAETN